MNILGIPALSEAWFQRRREGITATDVPKILGVSSFGTALDVWAEKTGKNITIEPEGPQLEWGRRTEEMHRQWVEEEEGLAISCSPGLVQDAEFPWLLATPDGLVPGNGAIVRGDEHGPDWSPYSLDELAEVRWRAAWEAKAPGPWTKKRWLDGEIPLGHQVQVQAQLRVCGLGESLLSQLAWPGVEVVHVERDDRFIENLVAMLTDFWSNNVQKDIPPEVDARDIDTIKRLYTRTQGTIELPDSLVLNASTLVGLQEDLTHQRKILQGLEDAADYHKARIMLAMGGAEYATSGEYIFKRSFVNRKATEASTYQTFRRVKEIK